MCSGWVKKRGLRAKNLLNLTSRFESLNFVKKLAGLS